MIIKSFYEFKGGWFIGNFEPAVLTTKEFEVCYKVHAAGTYWEPHTHRIATEYNLLIWGQMIIQGQTLNGGDCFILEPGEISDPVFVTDCHVVVVKVPSIPDDKYSSVS